ncbi:uncharacterized protein [Aegilops tauschii subsp. strangulata]|nr:uncharacterized protein LOC109769038 [Aegilops tauschii subsp. strangulata]
MTTASPRRRHLRPRSSAAGPLDDDDLLCEILLRLPPQPCSLPRASLVCKRWRNLASDPGFSRRFRIHHRRSPPLLGFFDNDLGCSFLPTLEAPNRVSPGRFSLQSGDRFPFRCLGCRHGLVLVFDRTDLSFLVWEPVTGEQHRLACPPGFDLAEFDPERGRINRAVRHAGRGVQDFQVVLVVAGDNDTKQRRAFACVYSSETGAWGNVMSTLIKSKFMVVFPSRFHTVPAVLAGDSLYWILAGISSSNVGFDFHAEWQILEFDLERQKLAVIQTPAMAKVFRKDRFTVVRGDGGGLGMLILKDFTAQLWKRKMDSDGVASWELEKSIDLNKLLSLNLNKMGCVRMLRFAEDNNLLVLHTYFGLFTVQLQSLQFKKLSGKKKLSHCHPFESVYTVETCIGGGHGEANLLQNA